MSILLPFLALLIAGMIAAYFRMSLKSWVALSVAGLVLALVFKASVAASVIAALLLALVAVPLLHTDLRRSRITAPLLKIYTKMLPTLSETEQTAHLLREINREHTVIVVEHDMAFVRALDCKVTCLHEGSVLAEGSIDKVAGDERVIEVYLGR